MELKTKSNEKIIFILTTMMISIQKGTSFPIFEPREVELWKDNPLDSIWLPAVPLRDEENLQNDYGFTLIQSPKQAIEIDKAQKEGRSVYGTEIRSPPVTRQIGSNRLVKKDSFVSRNWGAGGLPFSVLYMTPHGPRTNQSTDPTKQADSKRPMDGAAPSATPKNASTRLSARNGTNGQPRRQYSIIPQLFISYGWGSLGK